MRPKRHHLTLGLWNSGCNAGSDRYLYGWLDQMKSWMGGWIGWNPGWKAGTDGLFGRRLRLMEFLVEGWV